MHVVIIFLVAQLHILHCFVNNQIICVYMQVFRILGSIDDSWKQEDFNTGIVV